MTGLESEILASLADAHAERRRRAADPALGERVQAVKTYQQRRFEHTYADLLKAPRYRAAARFFLDELYGPADFAQRDADFARIVPALVRLFPRDIVETVHTMAALHALSEALDSRLAAALPRLPVDAMAYATAWIAAGTPEERERQIAMVQRIGGAMERYTAKPMLLRGLKLMRGPARAAGLAALQTTLERGFEAFAEMRGAEAFLATVGERERGLARALFAQPASTALTSPLLGQLP